MVKTIMAMKIDKPKFNPNIHHRRSIRLQGYDYSQSGFYFITIACQDRICRFGYVENGEMVLNKYGIVAYNEWVRLRTRFPNIELDVFQIMPNHMHGIIVLNEISVEDVGAGFTPAQNNALSNIRAGASPAPTVSEIVGTYKSLVANGCLKIYTTKNETMGKLWQRNYYEHIIRNEQSYQSFSEYIINNPAKWEDDTFYVI
uniref:Transposase IS200-like domain-containing protein n=1 Tax=Chlorobium chlorochromatii (strain CaD3) TaxID=340177 RepID=Q3AU66_CHLCH